VLEATSVSLKKEAVELQSRHTSASKELGSLEGRMELGRSAAAELASATRELKLLLAGKKPAEAEEACKILERELIEISSRAQSISSELRRLEEGVKKLEPGMSKCPVCRSPITPEGMKHVFGECARETASMKEELKCVSSDKESKSRAKSGLDAALRRIQNLSERARMLEKQISESGSLGETAAAARASLSSLGTQLEAKRKSVDSISTELQKARDARSQLEDALAKAKKLAELQSSLARHEGELKSLGFGETEFESARTSFESARNEGDKLAISLASARSEHRSCAELLKSASSEAEDLESIARQVSKLERECEEMSIYRNALVETQAELRTEVVAALNSAMNEIWAIIYPYADYKGLRMIADESGYKFEISDGSWRPAELASGGERATIALSLRIALATVLTPNISMLILDEPTHNLDKEAVGVLARVLQYNLPELIGQAFVITHDEELMGSEFASTYRMRRDKKENGPTMCEEI
ncbi:MAG: AAA family ATPase, partial [Candidatus Micrarchaeia archaeon]